MAPTECSDAVLFKCIGNELTKDHLNSLSSRIFPNELVNELKLSVSERI